MKQLLTSMIFLCVCAYAQAKKECSFEDYGDTRVWGEGEVANKVEKTDSAIEVRLQNFEKELRTRVVLDKLTDREYEILGKIGSGGQAESYKAKRPDGKVVALKIPSSQNQEFYLKNEAKLLRELNALEEGQATQYFPKVYTLLDVAKIPVLEMELIPVSPQKPESPAANLGEVIEFWERGGQRRKVETREVDSILKQLREATKRAESIGIVHRDLKPTNILIDHSGKLKLIDLAFSTKKKGSGKGATGYLEGKQDHFTGTPEYASPKQILKSPATGADDVHALRKITQGLRLSLETEKVREESIFYRKWPNGSLSPDYKVAGERPGMSEAERLVAMAEWSRWPNSVLRYVDLQERAGALNESLKSYPIEKRRFLKWYGQKLLELKREKDESWGNLRPAAAREVLSSKIAIENFDSDQGFVMKRQDLEEIAFGVWEIFESTHHYRKGKAIPMGKILFISDHPYYHFAPFFDKLHQLHEEGKISDLVYFETAERFFKLNEKTPEMAKVGH